MINVTANIQKLITKIKNKKCNEFDIQELIRFYVQFEFDGLTLSEEVMIKDYIRRGASILNIPDSDLNAVYRSFRHQRSFSIY